MSHQQFQEFQRQEALLVKRLIWARNRLAVRRLQVNAAKILFAWLSQQWDELAYAKLTNNSRRS